MIELQAEAWPILGGKVSGVAERRAGYRRDWYREKQPASEDHPVSARVEERLRADVAHREHGRRILELAKSLTRRVDSELLPVWLELEALLNERAHQVAAEHYNEGVEDGRAQALLQQVAGTAPIDLEREPARAVRALADALLRVAERLP